MKDFLLVILAVGLLAVCFLLQKLYQKRTDGSTESSIDFSILSGISSILFLVITNGFSLSFTWFSAINGTLKSACCLAYTVIGFKIMQAGNMSLYMLFLMSGGMLVPTVWGWAFLGEAPKLLHILGLIVILVSIILNNLGSDRPSAKVLLMCSAVFVLNGFVSVFSKLHQVNVTYPMVSTVDYAVLSAIVTLVMSFGLKAFFAGRRGKKEKRKGKAILWPLLIAIAYSGISSVSSILQLEGAKNLPASMLYPVITGGTIAFTGIFALIFFKEKLSLRGWISVALCCLGTCFFV